MALDPNNVDAIFNYGLGIEGLARKFIDLDDEKGNDFWISQQAYLNQF